MDLGLANKWEDLSWNDTSSRWSFSWSQTFTSTSMFSSSPSTALNISTKISLSKPGGRACSNFCSLYKDLPFPFYAFQSPTSTRYWFEIAVRGALHGKKSLSKRRMIKSLSLMPKNSSATLPIQATIFRRIGPRRSARLIKMKVQLIMKKLMIFRCSRYISSWPLHWMSSWFI